MFSSLQLHNPMWKYGIVICRWRHSTEIRCMLVKYSSCTVIFFALTKISTYFYITLCNVKPCLVFTVKASLYHFRIRVLIFLIYIYILHMSCMHSMSLTFYLHGCFVDIISTHIHIKHWNWKIKTCFQPYLVIYKWEKQWTTKSLQIIMFPRNGFIKSIQNSMRSLNFCCSIFFFVDFITVIWNLIIGLKILDYN